MFWRKKLTAENRIEPRRPVQCYATLHDPSGDAECDVRDISTKGVQVVAKRPPAPESVIALTIDTVGLVQGIVRWRDGHRIGALFTKVSPAVEERLKNY